MRSWKMMRAGTENKKSILYGLIGIFASMQTLTSDIIWLYKLSTSEMWGLYC